MTRPKIKNLIFDLDGTLIDSKLDIARSQAYAMRLQGFSYSEEDFLPLAGQPLHVAFRNVEPSLCLAELDALIAIYRQHYRDHALDTTVPFPGILEMLSDLYAAGVGLAVATTKGTVQARHIVEGLRLHDLLDSVFGTDPPLRYKPEPDLLLHVFQRLGWDARSTLAIGDAHTDLAAARAAECPSGAALWGAHDRERLWAENPSFGFESPAEILPLVFPGE
jgi:phosphoglycolate phosphatase